MLISPEIPSTVVGKVGLLFEAFLMSFQKDLDEPVVMNFSAIALSFFCCSCLLQDLRLYAQNARLFAPNYAAISRSDRELISSSAHLGEEIAFTV